MRCDACKHLRKSLLKQATKLNKKALQVVSQRKKFQTKFGCLKRKEERQRKNSFLLERNMVNIPKKMYTLKKNSERQRIIVKSCFDAAKRSSGGRKYNKK